jgi:hypothetical protein
VAICKTCGKRYSKWTTPVGARGVCGECFEVELSGENPVAPRDNLPPAPAAQETIPERRVARIRLTSFLPRSRSRIVFALVASCYCIAVGSFMSMGTWVAGFPRPPQSFYLRGDAPDVFGALVFAPVIESLMLVGVFELARLARAPDWVQVVTSALFISELHVWGWWPHALIVLPSFLIQSASFLYWRSTSWKKAFWVLVGIHALNNVIPTLSAVGRAIRHT